MNTVTEHLERALDALDTEIARLTEARNATAALIETLRPTAPASARPLTPPATGKARPADAGAPAPRPRLVPSTTPGTQARPSKPPAKRPPQAERPCPVPGCGRMCGSGPGLAAHLRNAHPSYVAGTPGAPAAAVRPAVAPSLASVESELSAL